MLEIVEGQNCVLGKINEANGVLQEDTVHCRKVLKEDRVEDRGRRNVGGKREWSRGAEKKESRVLEEERVEKNKRRRKIEGEKEPEE